MSIGAVRALALLATCLAAASARGEGDSGDGVLQTEFVFTDAPFASCHASTTLETRDGLAAAWFGGTREGHPDVGIWFAARGSAGWSAPREVATGKQDDGRRFPCWNPVLARGRTGALLLFYKVGPSPDRWWGMLIRSDDEGTNWSSPRRLPDGILGPIKNKPVRLADGDLLCPSSTEDGGWRVHLERTTDDGATWTKTPSLDAGAKFEAIQPAIVLHPAGRLQILCRSRQGRIVESWSDDGGKRWGPLAATELPNPNSGIDAVSLKDGQALLVYNHTKRGRFPLNVAVSPDGKTWKAGPVLEREPGEYSYPAVIQAADGRIHITYTWHRRRIKHVVLDLERLVLHSLPTGSAEQP